MLYMVIREFFMLSYNSEIKKKTIETMIFVLIVKQTDKQADKRQTVRNNTCTYLTVQ